MLLRRPSRAAAHMSAPQAIAQPVREGAAAGAGSRATADRPLAWVRLETNRATFRHELTARYWPGGDAPALLSEAHPHGAWLEWHG